MRDDEWKMGNRRLLPTHWLMLSFFLGSYPHGGTDIMAPPKRDGARDRSISNEK
jgi:hypothetical protein